MHAYTRMFCTMLMVFIIGSIRQMTVCPARRRDIARASMHVATAIHRDTSFLISVDLCRCRFLNLCCGSFAAVTVVERCSGHGGSWGCKTKTHPTAMKVGTAAAKALLKVCHLCIFCVHCVFMCALCIHVLIGYLCAHCTCARRRCNCCGK